MEGTRLEGLRTEDYIYPGEDNAFAAIKKIPVLDKAVAAFIKYQTQLTWLPQVQGDSFQITDDTCPDIYDIYRTALERLDMPEEYPLFVQSAFEYNVYATGGDEPFVVINSSVIKNLAPKELLFILGHELGHIKSGHLIYYNMARLLGNVITSLPGAGNVILSSGLDYALINWRRMQEFTADRAGAVACGGLEASIQALGRTLGALEEIPYVEFSIEDIKRQSEMFEEFNQNMVSKVFCMLQMLNATHPWIVDRIKALEQWKMSGEYERFLNKFV